jgi:hypothetical protein
MLRRLDSWIVGDVSKDRVFFASSVGQLFIWWCCYLYMLRIFEWKAYSSFRVGQFQQISYTFWISSPWRWSCCYPWKRRWLFAHQHLETSHKSRDGSNTVLRTSNFTTHNRFRLLVTYIGCRGRVSEWVSECVCVCVCVWVSEWVCEWVNEWASEWVSGWVSEWVCDWVSEWASEWVSVWVFSIWKVQRCGRNMGSQKNAEKICYKKLHFKSFKTTNTLGMCMFMNIYMYVYVENNFSKKYACLFANFVRIAIDIRCFPKLF